MPGGMGWGTAKRDMCPGGRRAERRAGQQRSGRGRTTGLASTATGGRDKPGPEDDGICAQSGGLAQSGSGELRPSGPPPASLRVFVAFDP